jgi:hypothetical protein
MIARWLMLTGLLAVLAGCQSNKPQASPAPTPAGPATISNTDPCFARLHDLSGAFLNYLLWKNDLPESLDQLVPYAKQLGVEPDFTCPASGEPYIYQRDGILFPEQNARIILYDAKPSHAGQRLAIILGEPKPGQPPQTEVIALPESFFLLRPSAR